MERSFSDLLHTQNGLLLQSNLQFIVYRFSATIFMFKFANIVLRIVDLRL